MKLIFCDRCQDVFKLTTGEIRECSCGYCRGKYLPDGGHAVTNGKGLCLAFANTSVIEALLALTGENGSKDYGITHNITAWARPHTGVLNPRTTIQENL